MNRTDKIVFGAMLVAGGAIVVGILFQGLRDQKDLTARVSGLGRKGVEVLKRNLRRGERESDEEALPA